MYHHPELFVIAFLEPLVFIQLPYFGGAYLSVASSVQNVNVKDLGCFKIFLFLRYVQLMKLS